MRILLIILTTALNAVAAPTPEQTTQTVWKLINGTNLPTTSATYTSLVQLVKAGKIQDAALMATKSTESSFAVGPVAQMFTLIAGREVNPREPVGDFTLTWMMAAVNDTPIPNNFLGSTRYLLNGRTDEDYSGMVGGVAQSIGAINSDKTLVNRATNAGQNYVKDTNNQLGVLTSVQYSKAIFDGGTTRRPMRKLVEDFTCRPFANYMAFNLPDNWVGRDIPRAPGGDAQRYLNYCVGCHAGMDATRGAFAYFDFQNDRLSISSQPTAKINRAGEVFPAGYYTTDDSWEHNGWLPFGRSQVGGQFNGPKALAKMISEEPVVYSCFAKRAKETLCPLSPATDDDFANIGMKVKAQPTLRQLFATVVTDICLK